MPSRSSIYLFFDIELIYLWILFYKVLINLSATTDFSSFCIEHIALLLSCKDDVIGLLQNPLSLSTHILFG